MKKISYFIAIILIVGLLFLAYQIFFLDERVGQEVQHIGNHDLSLPSWGPYTKKYVGISNIPDPKKGMRFDLAVFPAFFNKDIKPPNVLQKSNFHPWEASPELEYFSFRHELLEKDEVYADISYSEMHTNARAITINCVNNTAKTEDIALHFAASVHFPPLGPYHPDIPLEYATVKLPENGVWVDGLSYHSLIYKNPGHRYHLVYDGMLRGEVRENGLVNGSGIGDRFGKHSGNIAIYSFNIPSALEDPVLVIRYKTEKMEKLKLKLEGVINKTLKLEPSKKLMLTSVNLDSLNKGKTKLNIETLSNNPFTLDGFALVNKSEVDEIKIDTINWKPKPIIINGATPNSIIFKYEQIDKYYGLYWEHSDFIMKEWMGNELPKNFNTIANDTIPDQNATNGQGHFTNIMLHNINLAPNTKKSINGMVCTGTLEEVKKQLNNADQINFKEYRRKARAKLYNYSMVPAGEKYLFSQKRMAATTLTNVVYPVYTQKQYIRHHTPGRKWDCLYTWDSGFIGIGLSQLSEKRGRENLQAYLTDTTAQSAFIHHGTPLPVQIYLFQELWNKTQSQSLVEENYPKLKQYYEFLSGKTATSTTNNLDSDLIKTWDYFYNSGGWDDYPPQKYMHNEKLAKTVTPVVSTAHVIRMAKILQLAALHLKKTEDFKEYEIDINNMSNALNTHAWDETSGYYGYVKHTSGGKPTEILKYNDTINFNMGLGGISPIIAGITNEKQKKKILSHLKTEGKIWSDIGLSTVDQSAPYFDENGYWNGRVWMPHQWFLWKSMLDIGEADFAHKIATTALDLWKRETERTNNSYENFSIKTKKGLSWYQFSGLSSPVLAWFNAYYQVGNLTPGFNIWVTEKEFNKENTELHATLKLLNKDKNDTFSLIACLNHEYEYEVYWNDKKVAHKELNKGTLSITITTKNNLGNLKIIAKEIM